MELTRYTPPGHKALDDNAQWTNRFEIKSESSDRVYIVAQNKKTGDWGCSCPAYRTRRSCKHLQSLHLPTPAKLLGPSRSPIGSGQSRGFMDHYRRYDTNLGRGSIDDWKDAFNARMGIDEARRVMGGDDPFVILGVSESAQWSEVRSAYRKLALMHHPDAGGDRAKFERVQAAFEVLEEEHQQGRLA